MPSFRPTGRAPRRHRVVTTLAAFVAMSLVLVACGSSSLSTSTRSHVSAAPMLPIANAGPWGTTWSYNPYSSDAIGIESGLVLMPLALEDVPSLTKFTPQLASRWSVSGTTFTVHLRADAKWQNGQPVTSKDLYDTILLDGTNATSLWYDITNVTAPNASEVSFTLRKGEPAVLAEEDILNNTSVYPASVYGRFVTPGLKADEIAYYTHDDTDPSAASKLPQYQAVEKAFNALTKFNPTTLLGDGPFELKGVTTSEAKLVKWGGFYGASKIHVGGITWYNGANNDAIYPDILNGEAAFSGVYLPPSMAKRWSSTAKAREALVPDFGYVMEFNDHSYPLDITKVRQALAYVIPRKEMTDVAYGTVDAGGAVEAHPDGLSPAIENLYLTNREIRSLNTYPVDTSKAATLLRSVGFHKSGSRWITPKGTPFTLNLLVNSSESDIVTSFESAASALSNFGIKSETDATGGAIEGEDASKGDFQIAQVGPNSTDPLGDIDEMLGTDNNFTTLGTYAGDRGIGFGPTAAVPGLGKVNVASTIDAELHTVAPGATMDTLTWDWARLINRQVPYLWYATKLSQQSYSTAHFTDWPPSKNDKTSPLWNIISTYYPAGLALALEEGYIRPTG